MSYTINNFITSDTRIQDVDKKISICLSANGFSFSIVSLNGKLLSIGDVSCEMPKSVATMMMQLREIFAKLDLRLPSYAETRVIEPVTKFTWIPEHLYKKGSEREYLQLVCNVDPKDEIKVEYSERMQSYCVFVSQSPVIPAMKILAPKMRHLCQHIVLAESAHLAEKSKTKPIVAVNVREGFMDMAVFAEQKLLMGNTFPCATQAEAVYQILSVMQNMQLRKEQAEVSVSGAVDREWYQYVSPYFAKTTLNTGKPLQITDDALRRVHIYKYALTLS